MINQLINETFKVSSFAFSAFSTNLERVLSIFFNDSTCLESCSSTLLSIISYMDIPLPINDKITVSHNAAKVLFAYFY
jgi:hypothetical protein